jgi:hypothetical protein
VTFLCSFNLKGLKNKLFDGVEATEHNPTKQLVAIPRVRGAFSIGSNFGTCVYQLKEATFKGINLPSP